MTSQASQAVGALLLVGLLAAPAGTAHRLTTHPYSGLVLAGLLAITELWAGLGLSVLIPQLPPSFTITAVASIVYLITYALTRTPTSPTPQAEHGDLM